MKEPVLLRVDFRLLHGQVVTGWLKKYSIKKLYIIDDATKGDSYLSMIFELAKPQGLKLQILSFAEAGKKWKENGLGIREKDSVMVLFKDINGARKAFDAGFEYSKLQVGTTEGGPGKTSVGVCFLSEEDVKDLIYLTEKNVNIYFQSNCDSKETDWKGLKDKNFPNL